MLSSRRAEVPLKLRLGCAQAALRLCPRFCGSYLAPVRVHRRVLALSSVQFFLTDNAREEFMLRRTRESIMRYVSKTRPQSSSTFCQRSANFQFTFSKLSANFQPTLSQPCHLTFTQLSRSIFIQLSVNSSIEYRVASMDVEKRFRLENPNTPSAPT